MKKLLGKVWLVVKMIGWVGGVIFASSVIAETVGFGYAKVFEKWFPESKK